MSYIGSGSYGTSKPELIMKWHFRDRLHADLKERETRPPRAKEDIPEWSTLDKMEADLDFGIDDYHEFLIDELRYNHTRNIRFVIDLYAKRGAYPNNHLESVMLYREYIRVEIEITKIIQARIATMEYKQDEY